MWTPTSHSCCSVCLHALNTLSVCPHSESTLKWDWAVNTHRSNRIPSSSIYTWRPLGPLRRRMWVKMLTHHHLGLLLRVSYFHLCIKVFTWYLKKPIYCLDHSMISVNVQIVEHLMQKSWALNMRSGGSYSGQEFGTCIFALASIPIPNITSHAFLDNIKNVMRVKSARITAWVTGEDCVIVNPFIQGCKAFCVHLLTGWITSYWDYTTPHVYFKNYRILLNNHV